MDAYQEALDLAVYLRQVIEEDKLVRSAAQASQEYKGHQGLSERETMHLITVHDSQIEVRPTSTCSCGWESGPQMTAAQARDEWERHIEREITYRTGGIK